MFSWGTPRDNCGRIEEDPLIQPGVRDVSGGGDSQADTGKTSWEGEDGKPLREEGTALQRRLGLRKPESDGSLKAAHLGEDSQEMGPDYEGATSAQYASQGMAGNTWRQF